MEYINLKASTSTLNVTNHKATLCINYAFQKIATNTIFFEMQQRFGSIDELRMHQLSQLITNGLSKHMLLKNRTGATKSYTSFRVLLHYSLTLKKEKN